MARWGMSGSRRERIQVAECGLAKEGGLAGRQAGRELGLERARFWRKERVLEPLIPVSSCRMGAVENFVSVNWVYWVERQGCAV